MTSLANKGINPDEIKEIIEELRKLGKISDI